MRYEDEAEQHGCCTGNEKPLREMLCGVGVGKINAEDGTPLGGYWNRESFCQGVKDDLLAHCVCLKEESKTVFLVSLDLVGLSAETVAELSAAVREECGLLRPLETADVFVSCSHTHCSPQTHTSFIGMGHADRERYMKPVLFAAVTQVCLSPILLLATSQPRVARPPRKPSTPRTRSPCPAPATRASRASL